MGHALPITIVGGGLADLTLGIALRRHDVPVTILEAGRYPRHRVCGEFINGRGTQVLQELELTEKLKHHGMREATTAAFFYGDTAAGSRALPNSGYCLSRFRMDAVLAAEFESLGGLLISNERWQGAVPEGSVRATGRRMKPVEDGWRWIGLKIHARHVSLEADLEMHFNGNGYVGLCRVEDDRVNICGLFRSRHTAPDLARTWREWLFGQPGSLLRQKLEGATFDDASFSSVAALSFKTGSPRDRTECAIGDALGMIPPVTGNGMSMALESAQMSAPPLLEFSRGHASWRETRDTIARRCDDAFAGRLLWAGWMQKALFTPHLSTTILNLGATSETIWRLLFAKTR